MSEMWIVMSATEFIIFFISVFQVNGARCVQWLCQQLHQCYGSDQESLYVQASIPGVPQGKLLNLPLIVYRFSSVLKSAC